MHLHRNSTGQVKAPEYGPWAIEMASWWVVALLLGQAYRMIQQQIGLNDGQMRQVVRKWAKESTGEQSRGD